LPGPGAGTCSPRSRSRRKVTLNLTPCLAAGSQPRTSGQQGSEKWGRGHVWLVAAPVYAIHRRLREVNK
jgi:hypothetical protein